MTTQDAYFIESYYSGTAAAKLTAARELYNRHAHRLTGSYLIGEELELLQRHALALDRHMQVMHLGRLCSQCATHPGGGCCSAYMADNTDSILLLTNLLLGIKVDCQHNDAANCCYLGERGCLFLIKPFFCLNYNCKTILNAADPLSLEVLYQAAGTLLRQQSRMETLLLEALRPVNQELRNS